MKLKNKLIQFTVGVSALTALTYPTVAYASATEVQSRLTEAGNTIQQLLTGLIVIVGICVALWIIIKRMPSADDPQEKSEVYKAVGRVLGLVAIGAAIVWVVPWVYSLFQ
ncbi:CagC family type IV secretion system protein [Pisciglobus halotolerans]|uniref:Cag pathogenicity island, type IV secretory system n=1 Tax=Pisciglobus halotolerans TaxID=745365 RepID=A0A1I3DA45_9LACT|nr:CagC family type IV secretion system protein [Pisciglobus halotolerans]SFH83590.1 Cag pathogenicity island, type IV secretory system [Pisciglobus halotolerans]